MNIQDELSAKIESRAAHVGVIGLGYVGLPLTLAFAECGFPVLGFDTDEIKITALNRGESYIRHVDAERIRTQIAAGLLEATNDFACLSEVDAVLICVPTPLTEIREPDLRYVIRSARAICEALRPGQLIVLESTTYPGTTEEVVRPLLEAGGLACGKEFFLAYSPEREDPGNPKFDTRAIPKVVGGCDRPSLELALQLYRQVIAETVPVSLPRVAEACKLTENIFRAVNIALVNELKVVFDAMQIDVWEVLDAAATKPFGFMRFDPGPGWGGHCIPIDPFYLSWKARENGVQARFIELAGRVNVLMPQWVVGKLEAALAERSQILKDSKILLLGLAYKRDVADPRESPAFELISLLRDKGAEVSYHDPLIDKAPAMRSWKNLEPLTSTSLDAETIRAHSAVVVVTDHSQVDYDLVRRHASLIVDTRGVYRHLDDTGAIVNA
ncbi:MAG: nucleotide sugar dehydrogenase [Acidobacteriota bacterium]|nr:nucleotide sugar dehydrogenase [Acidobacteriota bacterium]